MASAVVHGQDEDHQCPVCSDWFTHPKLLTCGHHLCRRCLLSWIQTQPHAGCPLCRCAIVDTEEKASENSLEDVVDSFPTDLFMEAWVESRQLLSEDHQCQACLAKTATSICTSCRDLLCASCATIHKRMSMSRHHIIEELSGLTPERLMSSRPSICSSHGDKPSEVYCPTHGTSICLLCATTNHSQCPDKSQLEKKVKEARTALAELRNNLHKDEAHLDLAIQQLDQHLQETQKKVNDSTAEIEVMCQQLESYVKTCRKRLNDLLQDGYNDVKEAVDEAKTCLLQRKGRLTTHDRVLERGEGVTSSNDVLGMARPMKRRLDSLEVSCILPPEAKVVSTFSLLLDHEAVARVERELAQLGRLEIVPAQGVIAQHAVLKFHDSKKGEHVVLSNDQQTAEWTGSIFDGHGIVLSCDRMEANCLYQVRVDQTDGLWSSSDVLLGVVTQSPETVTLPHLAWNLTSAVVVNPARVKVNEKKTDTKKWSPLQEVREGGRVGLMLDKKRTLHLYIEGRHVGEVTSDLPDPCHFMIDLRKYWQKVTALPVQRM